MLDQLARTQKYGAFAFIAGVLTVVAFVLLVGCSRQSGNAGLADQVRKQALGLVAAYNAGDAAAAAAYDAPDYVGIFHGTPNNVGPAADLAEMKAAMAVSKLNWQMGEPRVTVAKGGDIAILEAPYAFTVSMNPGGVTHETGNWVAIFKRQADGTLKLWRSIGSDTPPAKPAG
jgi:ketosteroid isomerase-like protein